MKDTKSTVFSKDIYYSYIENRLNLSVIPHVIGFERCRKSKPEILSDKTCYVLHYILSGQGEIHTPNGTKHIHQGQFFLLSPHSNISYRPNKKNPWSYIWIEMNGPSIREVLQLTTLTPENLVYNDTEDQELGTMLREMVEEDTVVFEVAEEALIASYILRFLSYMVSHHSKVQNVSVSKKEETTKAIENYLFLHYNDPTLSMEEVAKHFSFSTSYLTRLFKESAGITPTQYIDEIRMKKAIELLNHPVLSIGQIAEAVGYQNQFYFTRRFRKFFGMPPTQYKQKNSQDLG